MIKIESPSRREATLAERPMYRRMGKRLEAGHANMAQGRIREQERTKAAAREGETRQSELKDQEERGEKEGS